MNRKPKIVPLTLRMTVIETPVRLIVRQINTDTMI